MKKALTFKIGAISAILIAVFVAIPLVGATDDTSYSFTLMGPNVSKAAAAIPGTDIKAGDWLRVVGAGTFDTSTGAASGDGAFTHFNFDGTVHGRGTWTIKQFVSFTPYGGPHPGKQGGLLKIISDATTTEGEKFTFMVQISCLVNAPGGAPAEGFTVWGGPNNAVPIFGVVVSGRTLFHLGE